jgi:peptidoglycan DL-endopeptidase CwlO
MRRRLLACACLALLAVALPAHAQTSPAEDRLAEAQRKLDDLNTATEQATERFDSANVRLQKIDASQATLVASIGRLEATMSSRRSQVAELAIQAYKRGPDALVTLLDSPDVPSLTSRSQYLDTVANDERAKLESLRVARSDLEAERGRLAGLRSQAESELAKIAADRNQVEGLLADQRGLVAQYSDEVARIRAERAAEAEAARKRAEAAVAAEAASAQDGSAGSSGANGSNPGSGNGSDNGTDNASGSATGVTVNLPTAPGAATAVAWAKRELGKPYQYGAAGPDSFDCSGLTMFVWGKAGVSLPHAADAQYGSGPHVPRSQLQPGDLVFFGSDLHHVGIYIGGNAMIHAPQTGEVISYQDLDRQDYYGAVRPG